MSKQRRIPVLTPLLCAFALWLAVSMAPAWGVDADLKLDYSPLAQPTDIARLQQLAADQWLSALYVSFPETERAKIQVISVQNLDHGIDFHFEIAGNEADRRTIVHTAAVEIKRMADASPIPFAYRLSGDEMNAPSQAPTEPFIYAAAGIAVLGLLVMVGLAVRQRLFLALPDFHGLPVIGILPSGIGMGGRFLELQGPHCQALGVFFRRIASLFKPTFREAAVFSLDNLEASAAVTACLSIALLRERGRVLVVDLAGEESSLPAILEETDDAGELPMEGALRSTSISDLDLLTGLVPIGSRRPPLPADLLSRYRWVIYHAPQGSPLEQTRHVLVLTGDAGRKEALRGRMLAWFRKARLIGVALVGVEVPTKVRDTYMARFYFEKLRTQEVSA